MKKTITALIVMVIFPILAYAGTFEVLNRNSKVHQGGVLVVRISPELKNKDVRLFVFDDLYKFNNDGYVFIGVDVERKPGNHILYLSETRGGENIQYDFFYLYIEVLEKKFGTPWYVGPIPRPGKAVREQRKKEEIIKNEAYSSADIHSNFTNGPFVLPLDNNEETDQFGTLRLYGTYNRKTKKINVERKVPHGGVDLKARTPLSVRAINSGKVILTHYFPLRGTEGKMLIIDHGSGIISLYLHLSKFLVKTGDMVTGGQIVARTGATPRGTPPHLHLMVKVHGINVDPLAFIDTLNTVFGSQ